jgi:hypothetical protein
MAFTGPLSSSSSLDALGPAAAGKLMSRVKITTTSAFFMAVVP